MDDLHIQFLEARPPDLAPWVEQIWYSRGSLERLRERVLPSATTDIVANLGAPMRLVEGEGASAIRGTTVSGLLTRPILLEHPEFHEAIGARLAPGGLRAILGVPDACLRDLVVDLPDVLESATDELVDVCVGAPTPAAKLSAGIDWLRGRVARFADSGDPLARWAVSRIGALDGRLSISTLHEASGFGPTRFNQRFRDELGVTPKQFARLVRFRAALDALSPLKPLAELALDLGYADQAHMNRDFRTLGGTTPTEVLAARYSAGVTLAEE